MPVCMKNEMMPRSPLCLVSLPVSVWHGECALVAGCCCNKAYKRAVSGHANESDGPAADRSCVCRCAYECAFEACAFKLRRECLRRVCLRRECLGRVRLRRVRSDCVWLCLVVLWMLIVSATDKLMFASERNARE